MGIVNGGVKFFDKNYALFKNGSNANATSNDDSIKAILDISRYTQWVSIGSNDVTEEVITITFKTSLEVDRIFLVDHNFKQFTVKYNSGGTFIDFTNVVGVNGVTNTVISETDFNYNTAFYCFDSITTNQIQIKVLKTQIANEEKKLTQFIATKEIGTFQGFPRVNAESDRNETKAKALSRRSIIQKNYETNEVSITFKTHPFQNDIDIIETLFDREESFLVYPCGGRTGEAYFKIEQRNWRLEDIYNMQIVGDMKNNFEKGVYTLGVNKTIKMVEHI